MLHMSMTPSYQGGRLSVDSASRSTLLFFVCFVVIATVLLIMFFVYEVPKVTRFFKVDEANADARKKKKDVSHSGSESAESSDEDYDYFAPNMNKLRPKDGKKIYEKNGSSNPETTFADDPASSSWFGSSLNPPIGSLQKKDFEDSSRANKEAPNGLSNEIPVVEADFRSSKGSSEQSRSWCDSLAKPTLTIPEKNADGSFVGSLATGYLPMKSAPSPNNPVHSPRWVAHSPKAKKMKRKSSKKSEGTQKSTAS